MCIGDRDQHVKGQCQGKAEGLRDRLVARVARVASAFAHFLQEVIKPDKCSTSSTEAEFEEEISLTDVELGDRFQEFCDLRISEGADFDEVLQWLVGWRVLIKKRSGDGVHRFMVSDLDGKKPPLDVHFLYPLPKYKLNPSMVQAVGKGQGIPMNRKDQQHAMLFAEELVEMIREVCREKFEVKKPLPLYKKSPRRLHKIRVPAFISGQNVMIGNSLYVRSRGYPQHRGFIHAVCPKDSAVIVSFHPTFHNKPPFTVSFGINRIPFLSKHRAVDLAERIMAQLESTKRMIQPPAAAGCDTHLNVQQKQFLDASLLPLLMWGPPPFETLLPLLLWGPPGTGKTTTLVRTIWTIITKNPTAKVLVSAPSNAAANLLCERLSELGIQPDRMLRLMGMSREVASVPMAVQRFTCKDALGNFALPDLEALQKYQVIVCTCTTASYLRSSVPKEKPGWFSHVFVDEAAQSMEPETLIPLTVAKAQALVCLAGDVKQLGPLVKSKLATDHGFQVSLMERLFTRLTKDTKEHSRVFVLTDTYRSHPSILKLYNPIYDGQLQCCSPKSSRDMVPLMRHMMGGASGHPLIFHHCDGKESQNEDSTSWQNIKEGEVVMNYLRKLLELKIPAEDIGVITPYQLQCERLKNLCQAVGIKAKIGTTELFQGDEKRIILISTVRSQQGSLGFLTNYKRTNVALSRAKSLLLVVGNMKLLSTDQTWSNAIGFAKNMGAMTGDIGSG